MRRTIEVAALEGRGRAADESRDEKPMRSPRQHYGPRGLSARPEGVRGSGPALGPSSERLTCMFKQGHTQHPMSAYDPKRTLISLLGGSFCHRCRHAAFDLVGFRVMASSLRYQTIGSYRVAYLARHLQTGPLDGVNISRRAYAHSNHIVVVRYARAS